VCELLILLRGALKKVGELLILLRGALKKVGELLILLRGALKKVGELLMQNFTPRHVEPPQSPFILNQKKNM